MKDQNDFTTEINQSLNKFTQGLKDTSKFQRKGALEKIKKQIETSFDSNDEPNVIKFTPESVKSVFKASLNVLNDPIEKCRELTCELISLILEKGDWDTDMSSSLIITLFQRLGGLNVKESSEEIRLQLYEITRRLLELKSDKQKNVLEVHLQEFVSILINAIGDPFPEVKKTGCKCTQLLANKLAGQNFHMQSESLVKPILQNMTHQHSRVRKDMVECLCDVVMHGNNKSVDTCLPHLAQRIFDGATIVRTAVIKLCGTWLLDLPDRYSFWHKLMPLLLSGFSDETIEINELTESLWWDVGIKYEKENEEDLKDKLDFLEKKCINYPPQFNDKRPNVGCRELIRINASKIVPGILNDIGDWVEATRIKSMKLLYIMIWQCEVNTTQHLQTIIQTLFKASNENIKEIQQEIFNCSKLVGHFTDASLSLKFAFKYVEKMCPPNPGAMIILDGLILGSGNSIEFPLIIEYLELLNETSLTVDSLLQSKLITCCSNLFPLSKFTVEVCDDLKAEADYLLFKTVFTLSALCNNNFKLIKSLKEENSMDVEHMFRLVKELKNNCDAWNDNSLEQIVFAKLIKDYGLAQEIVKIVIDIFKICLNPTKDAQLRTRFLLLIPEIFHSSKKEDGKSCGFLETSIEVIINDMIIPNIMWKAGRSAGAVRMSAIASLALLIQTNTVKNIQVKLATIENLIKLLISVLDDENKSTRLYICNIYHIILKHFGPDLSKDLLHKLYPEFIKRLDDPVDDIRFEILAVFSVYMRSLNTANYDKILYQAHLQMIYENVLLYLDDSNPQIQTKVFELLKDTSSLNTELLLQEIDRVKSKHRSSKYCDDLINHCKSL